MSSDDLASVVNGIDVAKAECQFPSDFAMILGNIR